MSVKPVPRPGHAADVTLDTLDCVGVCEHVGVGVIILTLPFLLLLSLLVAFIIHF